MEPPFINLNQSEMSIVQSMRKDPCGKWSCKLCDSQFGSIMRLVTHLLTSCDQHSSLSTFSTMSAIHICTFFDEPGSIKMLECYIRVARENPDIMASNLDNDTDSEVSELANDTDSEVSGLDEGDHVGSLEPKNEDEEGTGPVWFVKDEKEGLLDQEEEEEEEEESTMDENATPKAKPQKAKKSKVVAKAVRAPRNQEFPAMPPHSLSADAKLEWTFRRDRKYQLLHPPLCYQQQPKSHTLTTIMIPRRRRDPRDHKNKPEAQHKKDRRRRLPGRLERLPPPLQLECEFLNRPTVQELQGSRKPV